MREAISEDTAMNRLVATMDLGELTLEQLQKIVDIAFDKKYKVRESD